MLVAIPSTTHSIDRSDASCGRNPAPSHKQDRGDRPKCSCQAIIGVRTGLDSGKGAYQYACCKQSAAPAINCSIEACIATQPTSWASLARRKTIVPENSRLFPPVLSTAAEPRRKSLQTLARLLPRGSMILLASGGQRGDLHGQHGKPLMDTTQLEQRGLWVRSPRSCLLVGTW